MLFIGFLIAVFLITLIGGLLHDLFASVVDPTPRRTRRARHHNRTSPHPQP